jgi:DNA-binding ferritin-like protein (Dps family)
MLQKALDLLEESRRETKRLQEALKEQIETTRELKEVVARQEATVKDMSRETAEIKKQMTEELQQVRRAARNYHHERDGRTTAVIR